jgi:hypothetical protein
MQRGDEITGPTTRESGFGALQSVLTGSGAQPVRYQELFSVGRDTEQSLQSSAEVKNVWNYTSAPPYVLMATFTTKLGIDGSHYWR